MSPFTVKVALTCWFGTLFLHIHIYRTLPEALWCHTAHQTWAWFVHSAIKIPSHPGYIINLGPFRFFHILWNMKTESTLAYRLDLRNQIKIWNLPIMHLDTANSHHAFWPFYIFTKSVEHRRRVSLGSSVKWNGIYNHPIMLSDSINTHHALWYCTFFLLFLYFTQISKL